MADIWISYDLSNIFVSVGPSEQVATQRHDQTYWIFFIRNAQGCVSRYVFELLSWMELNCFNYRAKSLFQGPGPQGHLLLKLPASWASIYHPKSLLYPSVSLSMTFVFTFIEFRIFYRLFGYHEKYKWYITFFIGNLCRISVFSSRLESPCNYLLNSIQYIWFDAQTNTLSN